MRKKNTEQDNELPNADTVKETRQVYMGRAKGRQRVNGAERLLKADQCSPGARSDEPSVFSMPEFRTDEEYDAWWDALPKVKAEVDPRLKERVKTSIRLSRRTIEGFDFLAKQKGIRSGQTLMKVVLESYLSKSLPPDF